MGIGYEHFLLCVCIFNVAGWPTFLWMNKIFSCRVFYAQERRFTFHYHFSSGELYERYFHQICNWFWEIWSCAQNSCYFLTEIGKLFKNENNSDGGTCCCAFPPSFVENNHPKRSVKFIKAIVWWCYNFYPIHNMMV